jgi:hypothetical protein
VFDWNFSVAAFVANSRSSVNNYPAFIVIRDGTVIIASKEFDAVLMFHS